MGESSGRSTRVRRNPSTRPANARDHAYRILRRVEEAGAYASILLEHAEPMLADPRDAALLHETVLGVLRRRAALDHAIERVSSRPMREADPPVRTALRIGAYELLLLDRVPDFAAVSTAVELVLAHGQRAAAGFVNAVLRAVARAGRDLLPPPPAAGDVAALALFHSHPGWWVGRLVARLGWERASRLLEADNEPAPTVLRPNLGRIDTAALAARLRDDGVETEPGRLVPLSLRILAGSVQRSTVLGEGLAWVQDEASQIVPALLGSQIGPGVVDLCAAPGGKALCLSQALVPDGAVVAADRSPARLRRLARALARLGIATVLPVAADVTADPGPFRGSFEDVLLDAPCTGTGTLRRHPEIRWRLTPDAVTRSAKRQRGFLEAAARRVAPGGRLVYSVCSLEPEEGEENVSWLESAHPELRPADRSNDLPGAARRFLDDRGRLRTSPEDGLDGFFAAAWVRS